MAHASQHAYQADSLCAKQYRSGSYPFAALLDIRPSRGRCRSRSPGTRRSNQRQPCQTLPEGLTEGLVLGDASSYVLGDLAKSVDESGVLKGFVEETLARALVHGKPLLLRRADRTWYAVADHKNGTSDLYKPLRAAVGRGSPEAVHGRVTGRNNMFWAESVALHLEERNGALWLMLRAAADGRRQPPGCGGGCWEKASSGLTGLRFARNAHRW